MTSAAPLSLLLLAFASIGVLVALVTWGKLNAFLALFVAALLVGFGAGMPALGVLKAFQDGIGATLGGIAAVIALGAMLGKLLAESGGAQVLAQRFSAFFGPTRAGLCIIALALVVGMVTWFSVGLLLLGVFIALLGEGTPATLSDRLTFYGSLFLMVCAPLFGCVSSIALSRGMERRRRWTVWGSLALHILLILITVPLMGFMGLIAIIPGAILILIAPVVVVYLLLPGTRAQFRQP